MDLRVAQARFRVGELAGEGLPDVALAMLATGLDSQSVRELAALDRPTLRDAAHLFERALAETAQPTLNEREAREILLVTLLEDIVAARIDPGAGANAVWARAFDFATETEWGHFSGLASEYEDHPTLRSAIGADIVREAGELLGQRRLASA
jgi:hypothetical protein